MAFTFIHTADWQIGKPFAGFDGELPAALKAARIEAIERIAKAARDRNARHVVVAGDVWDQETPTEVTLAHTLQALQDHRDIQWWLLPGNHDPARPYGLWQRVLQHAAATKNVHVLLQPEPVLIDDNVYLLPAPWHSKNPGRDLTAWMDQASTPDGAVRIGLAHGSTRDFGGETQDFSLIAADRAISAQLDYLALGDWHGVVKIDDRTWYSGTPEPDRFVQNDPGWCLGVTCEGSRSPPSVEKIATATYRWMKAEIAVVPGLPLDTLIDELAPSGIPRRKTLLEVTLSGRADLEQRAELQAFFAAAQAAFAHLTADFGSLETMVAGSDLEKIGLTGPVRQAAMRLVALSQDDRAEAASRQDATRALDLLFSIAARHQDGNE
jgi:DNA repair exonuclease SbcCD nuclease subunit